MFYKHCYMLFPDFRDRALTLSYDDGEIYDIRLAEIMKRNGIKGTFNLNSGFIRDVDRFRRTMTLGEARELFSDPDFEIAVHGYNHYPLTSISLDSATAEIMRDRLTLESEFGKVVRGMAYSYGDYNDEVVEMLKTCGIVYARTVIKTESFDIPTDWLRLPTTTHHSSPRLMELAGEFLEPVDISKGWRAKSKLFYLWGHSYEFEDNDNWHIIEEFCEYVGNRDDVWYATNMEVYEYVKAYDNLLFSTDMKRVYNPSRLDVYLRFRGQNVPVRAGETAELNE